MNTIHFPSVFKKIVARPRKPLVGLVLMAFLFAQCTSKQTLTNGGARACPYAESPIAMQIGTIRPAFDQVKVPLEIRWIDPKQDDTLSFANGSKVIVPADALVDAQGLPVTGKVEIRYREFHDVAELMASGIPMNDPVTGTYMVTAGMFELRGHTADGQEVFVQEGKSMEVQMASQVPGPGYDLFYLDEKKGEWKTLGHSEPLPLEPATQVTGAETEGNMEMSLLAVKNKETQPQAQMPLCPKAPQNGEEAFSLDVDYSRFPELRAYDGLLWGFVRPQAAENVAAFDTTWGKITLKPTTIPGEYQLVLGTRKKQVEVLVRPLVPKEKMAEAMTKYAEEVERIRAGKGALADAGRSAEVNLITNAGGVAPSGPRIMNITNAQYYPDNRPFSFVRLIQAASFGIFNCDAIQEPEPFQVSVMPVFDEAAGQVNSNGYQLYLVMGKSQTVITYGSGKMITNFRYRKNLQNSLIAVLPDNRVAVLRPDAFKAATRNARANDMIIFEMVTLPDPVQDMEDIKLLVDRLI